MILAICVLFSIPPNGGAVTAGVKLRPTLWDNTKTPLLHSWSSGVFDKE